ncbi:MAG: hypothetical protein IPP77_10225 [Bacteroidetes bacterium]|nr:hypothetical protein [Bacteroidota bacterium]
MEKQEEVTLTRRAGKTTFPSDTKPNRETCANDPEVQTTTKDTSTPLNS